LQYKSLFSNANEKLISQRENGRVSWPKIKITCAHISKLHLINLFLDIIMSKLDEIIRIIQVMYIDKINKNLYFSYIYKIQLKLIFTEQNSLVN